MSNEKSSRCNIAAMAINEALFLIARDLSKLDEERLLTTARKLSVMSLHYEKENKKGIDN